MLALRLVLALSVSALLAVGVSAADDVARERSTPVPDLRVDDEQDDGVKGSVTAVPIPLFNPVLEAGLIGVAGYYYPQTPDQAATQPPSATGLGVLYTGNGSWGVAAGHAGYYREDRWRMTAAAAYAEVKLPILGLGENAELLNVDWLLDGYVVSGQLSRHIGKGRWYAGITGLYVHVNQTFDFQLFPLDFALSDEVQTAKAGPVVSYDSRDVIASAYSGRYFEASATFSREGLASDENYESFDVKYSAYHQLRDRFVLAWEAAGCMRSSGVPLWDACQIGLRGFTATDYLGRSSARAQVEARYRFSKRIGAVAFAGGGQIGQSLNELREYDFVPSIGAGLRFTVNAEDRINVRLDVAWSTDSNALHLFVGEAF